jgi:hypothetical protein
VIDYILNYQRKWNMWTEWMQETHKFCIISQEDKNQLDFQWE